jgi:hypothetical protein
MPTFQFIRTELYNVLKVQASRSNNGLAFVPNAVDRFPEYEREVLFGHLLQLYSEGLIELRPDSGSIRFTTDELNASPPGPMGSRLLWARICEPEEQTVDQWVEL